MKCGLHHVQGVSVDEQTRCAHYHSELDIIALRFACCDTYYPCHLCHEEVAGHTAVLWPQSRFQECAVLCGVCASELTVYEYLACDSRCIYCKSEFNPGCKDHLHLYFAMESCDSNRHALQKLFADPIRKVELLPIEYEDHASDIWRVTTSVEDVIVRASRMSAATIESNPFLQGAHELFGATPYDLHRLRRINEALATYGTLPVPKVLRIGSGDSRQYAVVERMQGRQLSSFIGQPPALLEGLGASVAKRHLISLPQIGQITGDWGYPIEAFSKRIEELIERLLFTHYGQEQEFSRTWEEVYARYMRTFSVNRSCPILLDFYAGQFLHTEDKLTALVDTEFIVAGPPELELIILEYLFTTQESSAFACGYRKVRPLPVVSEVRAVYRLLCRLLGIHGSMDLLKALNWPIYFV